MIILFELTKFLIFIIEIFFENFSKDFLTIYIKSFCPIEFRYKDNFLKTPVFGTELCTSLSREITCNLYLSFLTIFGFLF
jgi:hypothetical protein